MEKKWRTEGDRHLALVWGEGKEEEKGTCRGDTRKEGKRNEHSL